MITYVQGDATKPSGEGPKIICHVVNSEGGWGAGFVLAISKRWKSPEREYRKWHREGKAFNPDGEATDFKLGNIQMVEVDANLYVCNMLAQAGYGPKNKNRHRSQEEDGEIPLKYNALFDCLTKLAGHAQVLNASVHMPRIGCALAGGSWALVEPLIKLALKDIPVTVYDYGPFNP
jgi:O-acetyl-ADP-ribose deacetylase (regulator of RNase III)